MSAGDRVSTWLGAPPHHWKKSEMEQVKQIHRCFKTAFKADFDEEEALEVVDPNEERFGLKVGNSRKIQAKRNGENERKSKKDKKGKNKEEDDDESLGDDDEFFGEGDGKRDEEFFLKNDSPLRSKNGDKKTPQNPPFKDYQAFINSCHIDYWRQQFELPSDDRILSETAETIVNNICNSQSRGELRVKNGYVPLRKKREQITPLALVLHEMKLWATHELRTASVFEEKTFKGIKSRMRYIDMLSHKEVWGGTAVMLGSGMHSLAHDKLFRLLLNVKELLERSYEYAYRGYSRRSSREKLSRAGHLLKNVVLRGMKTLSCIMTLNEKLEDPKTKRLQPSDLLNSIKNQSFVDYRNLVNVLLYKLCQNPLVRAALTAEYEKEEVKEAIADLKNWSQNNLFCKPSDNPEIDEEPDYLTDQTSKGLRMLPAIYGPTAHYLERVIKEHDRKAVLPLSGKKHVRMLVTAYESEENAAFVMKLVMKVAAAIQDAIPPIFALHQLWVLAGEGGDYTIFDTLREQVMMVMSTTIERVKAVESTEKSLLKEIRRLCDVKEKAMEQRRLKDRKVRYKPAWVMNYKFLVTDLMSASKKGYRDCTSQLFELANDANEYSLTSDQLDDKVENVKQLVVALTGQQVEEAPAVQEDKQQEGAFPKGNVEKKKSISWLNVDDPENMDDFDTNLEFGGNNAFGDVGRGKDQWAGESSAESRFNPFAGEDSDNEDL